MGSNVLPLERPIHRWTLHQFDIARMRWFSGAHGDHRLFVIVRREERHGSHSTWLKDVLLEVFFEGQAGDPRNEEPSPIDTDTIVESSAGLE
jgi:hypothetical protein